MSHGNVGSGYTKAVPVPNPAPQRFFLVIDLSIRAGGANMTVPMTNGGTGTVPLLVMEMQTGSTNNHISQIFFVFAAPMYWWD
jgi:hypothetical protein